MSIRFQDSTRQLLLLLLLCCSIQSCNYSSDQQIQALTEQVKKEREALEKEREYIRYFLKSFLTIQNELGRIAEEKEVLVSPYMQEGREGRGEKILRYIRGLEQKITDTENTLNSLTDIGSSEIRELRNQIVSYKSQLNRHRIEISNLKSNNYQLKERVKNLNENLTDSYERIEEKDNVIREKTEELNKKYCIVVLRNSYKKVQVVNRLISFDIKIKKNDLLSYHPAYSYSMNTRPGGSTITINNWEQFWSDSNSIIIRSGKNSCRVY